jgi:hypothetical protein
VSFYDLYIFRPPLAHLLRGLSIRIHFNHHQISPNLHLDPFSTPIIFQLQLAFLAQTWPLYSSAAWVSQPPRSEQSREQRRNASRNTRRTLISSRSKTQIGSVNSPTKESTRDQWTAERCMEMVLPITVQRCSSIQETAQLRTTRHTARQSTMTLPPKKQHQGILDHRARAEIEHECHYLYHDYA